MDLSEDEEQSLINEDTNQEAVTEDAFQLATDIYQHVWKEYYDWEEDHCRTEIERIRRPNIFDDRDELEFSYDRGDLDEFELEQGPNSMWMEVFDEEEAPTVYFTVTPEVINASAYNGYPQYSMCTPASTNYYIPYETNATAESVAFLSYIPFSDDPDFPMETFANMYDDLEWQKDFPDPDLELIHLETAIRLHRDYDFTFPEIDRLRMLRKIRIHRTSGLLWDTSQRDMPVWTGAPGGIDEQDIRALARSCFFSSSPEEPDLFADINVAAPYFCPKRTCIRLHCPTHSDLYPGLNEPRPRITKEKMKEACRTPCSDECIYYLPDDDDEMMMDWELSNTAATVRSIIKVLPDASPCDLAVITRIMCREVFALRCQMFSDEMIERNLIEEPAPRFIRPHFVDGPRDDSLSNPDFVPPAPCNHRGPCNIYSSCECYKTNQHCQRSCRCELDCEIRWKGCKCGKSSHKKGKQKRKRTGPFCKDMKCACKASGRECDPELCQGCESRKVIGAGTKVKEGIDKLCKNVMIQRGLFYRPAVKRGSFGFGAFAREDLPRWTVLGEYTSEIIPSLKTSAFDRIDLLNGYTGLNYMFGLNSVQGLDALRVGNETRYINDPKGLRNAKANCQAFIYNVDGDHRIILQTTRPVKEKQELYLDYGDSYWAVGKH